MKKLLCLVFVAVFMVACSSDSTDPAPQTSAPAPAAKPAEEAVQQSTEMAQQGSDRLAALVPAAATFDNGSSIYQQSCRSCHDSGMMGAPKIGHARYSADIDVLVENSIKGIGRMPARGGNRNLSDDEVRAAVEYMVEKSK